MIIPTNDNIKSNPYDYLLPPILKDDKYRRWPKYRVKKTINTENDQNQGHRKDDNVRRWQTIKVQTEDIRFNLIPSLKGTLERTSVQCNFNKIFKKSIFFSGSKDRKSLNHVPAIMSGYNGVKGMSKNCHGKNAEHQYIEVWNLPPTFQPKQYCCFGKKFSFVKKIHWMCVYKWLKRGDDMIWLPILVFNIGYLIYLSVLNAPQKN